MAQGPQVKFIKVSSFDSYVRAKEQHKGAIVFAEFADGAAIDDASNGVVCPFPAGTKLIYANGIEYNVTNLTKFNEIASSIDYLDSSLSTLYEIVNDLNGDLGQDYLDLSTYVHTTVDGSISDISTRLANTSTRLNDTSVRLADASLRLANVSTSHNDLSTYVRTTVDGSISDISTRLSGALNNASLYVDTTSTDSSVKIALGTNTVGGTTANTSIKVNGSEYVNVQHANGAVSVSLQNITNSVNDINASSNKLVKADDLHDYVTAQINNLEGALIFRSGVADASAVYDLNPETGDVYVATGEFEFKNGDISHNVENGDLLIYGENEWVVVERNLDGAVEAGTTLVEGHVVVGDGNQTVKTTDFILPTVDNSTGIKDATVNTSVLTTQYAVKDYVDNELADVKVSVSTGTPTYVDVNVDPSTGRDISVGVKIASLEDYADLTFDETKGEWVAADGKPQPDGLATAADVAKVIQDNELVVSAALNTFKDKIGLGSDLSIDWEGKYEDGTSIVEAIKNIDVTGDITTAVEDLNSSVAAATGKVLTKVVQENGKLTAKEEVSLEVNGILMNTVTAGGVSKLSVEIDGSNIKMTNAAEAEGNGVSNENNPTINTAIYRLRDGKIGSITSVDASLAADANANTVVTSDFVQIEVETTSVTNVSKCSSVSSKLLVTTSANVANALATDAYVQEQIANALCWLEF